MTHLLLIVDSETSYAKKLSEYINSKDYYLFSARSFADPASLNEYIAANTFDLILVGDTLIDLINIDNNDQRLIVLSHNGVTDSSLRSIYKYQNCDNILRDILKYASADSHYKSLVSRKNNLKIIGFFSPVHRSYQTALALSLGKQLSKHHRTLYINLESFPGLDCIINRRFDKDLSEIMYSVNSKSSDVSSLIAGYSVDYDNLDILPTMNHLQDFQSIPCSEWLRFFQSIEETTDYEYIILDISECINGLFDILHQCSKIITTIDSDTISTSKLQLFENNLTQYNISDADKIVRCNLFEQASSESKCYKDFSVAVSSFSKKLQDDIINDTKR